LKRKQLIIMNSKLSPAYRVLWNRWFHINSRQFAWYYIRFEAIEKEVVKSWMTFGGWGQKYYDIAIKDLVYRPAPLEW
jgi:hypothetical protein